MGNVLRKRGLVEPSLQTTELSGVHHGGQERCLLTLPPPAGHRSHSGPLSFPFLPLFCKSWYGFPSFQVETELS